MNGAGYAELIFPDKFAVDCYNNIRSIGYIKLMRMKGWINQGVIKGARVNQDFLSVMVLFVKQY